MMKRSALAMLGLVMTLTVGCGESGATKFCLGPDGTSQDCGIGCKIEKNEKACKKWEEKTKELCGKITKEQCDEICKKDENPTACELVKNWKDDGQAEAKK